MFEPDDLCDWWELVSGRRVEADGSVTNLMADEWLQRWQGFRSRHTAQPPLPWNQQRE
jgi:hypothetical protein